MANYYMCLSVFKFALPIILIVCMAFRPCLLSAIYLLLLLLIPWLPVPTIQSMSGITGIYLKIVIAISVIGLVAQVAFQVVLFSLPPYAHFLENCSDLERYLRYGGFVKLNGISVTSATTWLTPEIILCIGSIVIFGMCKKLTTEDIEDGVDNVIKLPKVTPERRLHGLIYSVGKYLALISLCVAAILRPSVQGGFYFLIFLSATTWWACNKKLRKGFAYLLRFVLVVVLFHIIALYAYQFQLPQEKLPRDNRFARYFGLTPLMTVDCNDPRNFLWVNAEWASFLNPFALLWLYFILAMESKLLLMPHVVKSISAFSRLDGSYKGPLGRQTSNRRTVRAGTTRQRWRSATRKVRVGNVMRQTGLTSEQTPLIRSGASPSRKYGTQPTKATVLQDSTGSVIVTSDGHDDIPMEDLGKGATEEDEEEDTPTLIDNIVYAFGACVQVLVRSSYIVTNIIMMAWSITFHSWITFVLLLWANVLWMVPNQRRAMLRCSPFLVIYAWFLLIAAYAFSMNLNNDELPTIINGVELGPIGFEKIEELPCKFLLVKCLYTGMFWITMRQFMKERREARRSSTIADMVAPLQVTVGTAAGVPKKEQKGNEAMQLLGRYIKNFLTKFWIWVVAITLFAVAMVGTRVTGFKIIYMALFLIFILSFQISFRIWRRMMFGFWLVVILYSMLTLVLIYTYQFRSIRGYWKTYVGIDKEQQEDIGLEHYKTRELFIRLVTPTFFVIITVVQLHYFHKDFMDISDPKIGSIIEPSEGSSAQGGIVDHSSMKTDVESSIKFDISQLAHLSSARVQQTVRSFLKQLHRIVNLFYIFMELHLPKFVMLLGMLLCVYDKCAIYLIVVIFIVLSFTLGRPMYIISMFTCSILVSVMLLTRMIYQIHYINHDTWDVNCTDETNSTGVNYTTGNTAEWLGVRKAAADNTLPELVKWNIIFILAVTLWSVVSVRQYNYRLARGWSTKRPYFMFPSIKRADADKNIKNCLKYFLNYGYYKFGIEISLIALVAVIGFRMDVVALIYACWLCILCYVTRTTLSRLWDVFLFFIVIFIPIQYCMVIGFPPNLCLLLPWDTSETLKRLQEWAYLIDRSNSLPAKKLICDFILLLLVSRQAMVFRIERRNVSREYPGGSNESIIHHAEEKGFVNPVPDFITYCRSYLDVLKRTLLLSFMWITLAIVFLAGTNRVTLFSIGYVIGSFIFLWQGQDLYLKPIKKLLVSWDLLLGYNVAVIFIKTATQLAGCVYIETLEKNACWLVQLLAIGCVNKFSGQTGPRMSATCELPRDHIGLVWDGITFACLLLQRRVYSSYNFFHMVNETKATAILASRGADLIEELREKRMKDQDEEERKVLEKIKAKMDRIKRTQQKLHGPAYKDTNNHFVDQPPLARSTSTSSCTSATSQQTPPAGYHTPIDEEEPAPLTPHAGSILQTQVPSPFSAVMTGSLDAYLEPQRISFSSPPNSELNPRPPSPDDSFPVFSPPPYEAAPPYTEAVSEAPTAPIQRQSSIGPPWMQGTLVTPRQSIISYSSRSPLSHHTYGIFPNSRPTRMRRPAKTYKEGKANRSHAIRSGDYYMFDDMDDEEIDLEEESEHEEDEFDDDGKTPRSRRFTVGELLSTTMKTDINSTVRSATVDTSRQLRRSSMPVRRRSTVSGRSQISVPYSAPPAVSPRSVAIVEPKDKIDKVDKEPQPSTSKDEDDISEMTEPKEQTALQKIVTYLVFIWLFIESALVSITNFLNKYSRDYRYVLRTLNKEKKLLKENTDYNVGLRLGRGQMWQPVGSYHSLLKEAIKTPEVVRSNESSDEKPPISEEESESKPQASSSLPYSPELDSHPDGSHIDTLTAYEEGELSSVDQPTIIRLCLAIWYLILSHSDILCYFMIFLNQIKTATFLSLPLPLMVFIWGTLSIPRPSKTFWVTIIAYTEIIVLIKCLFQFQILPWNKRQILYPFFPPRIIGVEKRSDYALWDLLLLLIVFFHRFLLKCLGLWKSTYVPAVILSDGDYKITENELRSIQEDPKAGSVVLAGHSGSIQPITLGTARKGSDLQKLVEESEDSVEDETKDEKEDNNDEEDVITVQTEQVNPCTNFATSIRMAVSRYAESMRIFFKELMDPTSRVAVDVYSYMFLCDFFNFFVILIGYSSFGPQQGDEGVQAYLEENRVPVLFLLMLILQFTLIIIDRAIFLRKYIGGKVVFQYIQIVILHIWLFIVYPLITERGFNSVLPPQMYYMVKCFYLLLSAYQIRCGYPTRILGNFICKGYTYLNMFLFKGFMAVPFLFELRTIMDWMWTDTSMTIFDWIKMEDIFAHIFQLKCTRHAENEFPQPRGERKSPIVKYFMGGAGLVLLIAIIWFPLVFFSLGNAVGKSNIPYDLTVDLRIGPYQPIYQMSVQSNSINAFNNSDWDRLLKAYENNKTALTFISNYEPSDVAAIKFSSDSASVWSISPPDRDRMLKEVNSTSPLTIRFQYQVSHKSNTKEDSGIIREEVELILEGGDPVRQKLYEMLSGSQSVPPVELQYILPKFIKVTNKGTAKRIPQLMAKGIDSRYSTLRHVTIDHMQSNATQDEPVKEWWKMSEVCNLSEFNYLNYLSKLPYSDECKSLIMYTFNDKIFPSQLNFIAAGGIIGVYTTIVLVAGRLLRGFFAGMCFKIMFEDMPNVDRVLQLCYDVYLVREVREYCLEEDLFAKLVFLFRSPETLIKWTRPKEEANDEEDEEDDDDVEQQRPRQD